MRNRWRICLYLFGTISDLCQRRNERLTAQDPLRQRDVMRHAAVPLRESRDPSVRATNVPVRVAAVLEVEAAAVADVALDGEGEAVGRREAG